MKAKDLPPDTNLQNIKLRLPQKALKAYKDYAGGEPEMYIVGGGLGDFFMSPIAPDHKGQRRLYPLPPSIDPKDMLEWEVV